MQRSSNHLLAKYTCLVKYRSFLYETLTQQDRKHLLYTQIIIAPRKMPEDCVQQDTRRNVSVESASGNERRRAICW